MLSVRVLISASILSLRESPGRADILNCWASRIHFHRGYSGTATSTNYESCSDEEEGTAEEPDLSISAGYTIVAAALDVGDYELADFLVTNGFPYIPIADKYFNDNYDRWKPTEETARWLLRRIAPKQHDVDYWIYSLTNHDYDLEESEQNTETIIKILREYQ